MRLLDILLTRKNSEASLKLKFYWGNFEHWACRTCVFKFMLDIHILYKLEWSNPETAIIEYCQCSWPDDFSYVVLKNGVYIGICLSNTIGSYDIQHCKHCKFKI